MKNRANNLQVNDLPIDIKSAIHDDNLTFLACLKDNQDHRLIYKIMIFACIHNKIKTIKLFFDDKKNTLTDKEGSLLYQVILHNQDEILDYTLTKHDYPIKEIEKACVIAVKYNKLDLLKILIKKAQEKEYDFNLSFKKSVCMRLAISKRQLDTIAYLHSIGLSPFGSNVRKTSHHLISILKNDDDGWMDYYLDHNILKATDMVGDKYNFFTYLIFSNHDKAKYYLDKIIEKISYRDSSIKELKTLHNTINYIYPSTAEEKVGTIRNSLCSIINYQILNKKLETKEIKKKIKI